MRLDRVISDSILTTFRWKPWCKGAERNRTFKLGVEPRDEFLDIEVVAAAHKLVTDFRPLQSGQQVLISGVTALAVCSLV
jgi:hypothetical protein